MFVILSLLVGVQQMEAQPLTVTGRVVSETAEPLVGVNIVEEGTTNGVVTDLGGNFSIKLGDPQANLTISYIGYTGQSVAVNGRRNLDIVLAVDSEMIDEVVVVGYGVQKKSNVSGAITSLSSRDLHSMSTNDGAQAMQGKAPMYISRRSGLPGEGSSIYMRGVGTLNSASPLWIIDGVPGMPSDNFGEVESIQILKDAASSAIYGVQGANGVILVTTKKAAKGKISVNYKGYVKINSAMGLPKPLGTQGYIDLYKARWKSNNPDLGDPTADNIKSFYFLSPSEVAGLPNTNWVDEMFGTGVEHVHNLNISGSTDKTSYMLSAMAQDDKGTYVGTGYKKYSIKTRFEQSPLKWLKFSQTVNYSHSKRTENGVSWEGMMRGNPAMEVYADDNPMDTGYGWFTEEFRNTVDWQGGNPLESAKRKDHWQQWDSVWAGLQAIVTPLDGLVWTTNLSGAVNKNVASRFNYNTYGGISVNSIDYVLGTGVQGHQLDWEQAQSRSYLFNSYLNYDKTFGGKHDLGAMIGFEMGQSRSDTSNGFVEWGLPAEDFRSSIPADRSRKDGNNNWSTGSSYSLFGRLVYSYDGRYSLTANIRNDNSDKFAPGKRSAWFPSVSVGWNIANEHFFDVRAINEFKLRFGIGELGNSSVDSNLWRQEYRQQANGTWQATKVVNKNVTWEKTRTTNIGIDLGVWNNALTASIDLYDKQTRDALLRLALPGTVGIATTYQVNRGEVSNRGVELALSYRNSTRNFRYMVGGNVSYNKNKVLDIGNATYLDGGTYNRTFVNGPVSAFYGYVADGLYRTQAEIDALDAAAAAKYGEGSKYDAANVAPGDIRFKDVNGDGHITAEDMTSIGDPWPTWVFGLNIYLAYKGFDLNMNWQGVADRDIYNDTRKVLENMNADWNSTADVWNAWSPSNTGSSQPRLGNATHNYGLTNSYMIEDGSYLRLKNIQLGYNFPASMLSKIKLSTLRVYVAMENALTITKFKGFDPEFIGTNNYQQGVYGLNQYPQSRTTVIGLEIGF